MGFAFSRRGGLGPLEGGEGGAGEERAAMRASWAASALASAATALVSAAATLRAARLGEEGLQLLGWSWSWRLG